MDCNIKSYKNQTYYSGFIVDMIWGLNSCQNCSSRSIVSLNMVDELVKFQRKKFRFFGSISSSFSTTLLVVAVTGLLLAFRLFLCGGRDQSAMKYLTGPCKLALITLTKLNVYATKLSSLVS